MAKQTKAQREQVERAEHIARMESLRSKWGNFMTKIHIEDFFELREFLEYIWEARNHERAYLELADYPGKED